MKKNKQQQNMKDENKLCPHPHFEKEYFLGFDTGDIICSVCGMTFSRNNYSNLKE